MKNRLLLFCLALIAIGCGTNASDQNSFEKQKEERWIGLMEVKNDSIPFRFSLLNSKLTLLNGEERIDLFPDTTAKNQIEYSFPQYDSKLIITFQNSIKIIGYWNYYSKGNYVVPFSAHLDNELVCAPGGQKSKYQVVFSPGNISSSQIAIGLFDLAPNNCLTGTFLTESGDYRYLQGERIQNEIWLSCFDGAHLFYFSGTIKGDSIINGKFLSGYHWEEAWCGVKKDSAKLQHPDSLTKFVDGQNPLVFHAKSLSGNSREFGLEDYIDKVTIVQIFGSWCPNCFDELKAFSEINTELADNRLQIIPVAFERSDSLPLAASPIKKAMLHANLSFEPFFGGKASKNSASEVFKQLNCVSSFPTAIIIDKNGKVRKIHTGFYGPGTGHHHQHYKSQLTSFLRELLNE